ncbi:MAG TPA: hypothetical protein VJ859_08245 [Allosphingosinicella sp.]|nr:hypothetical protein [Allosphingosinicella sp.]
MANVDPKARQGKVAPPGLTLEEIATSILPLPDRDALSEKEREAFDYIMKRSKVWFESTPENAGKEYRMSPLYVGFLQSPEVSELWIRLTDMLGTAESRGSFKARERDWIRLAVPVFQKSVIQGLQIADAVASGIDPTDILALMDGRLGDLPSDDRQLVEYIEATLAGNVTREIYQPIEARLGRKGAVEYTSTILFMGSIRRLIEAYWAIQGYELPDPSTDYEVVRSIIDGTAPVHGYDRLDKVVKEANE